VEALGMMAVMELSPVFSRDGHGGGDELVVLNGERRKDSFGVNVFHAYGMRRVTAIV
jgi:hypothetical protein